MKYLCEPRGVSELTRDELRVVFFYAGGDRERCDKLIEGRGLYEQNTVTMPWGGIRIYPQYHAAALPRKHIYCGRPARECVSLVHVDVADIRDIGTERLHEGTGAHVV